MPTILEVIEKAIDEKKGEGTILYDFKDHSPFVDYVFITSASNSTQVNAIANYIATCVKENGYEVRGMEGNQGSPWILVDCQQVIVHVFETEERALYKLEKLYGDVLQVELKQ
ncbi:MAG: ribosome silencing factor [Erysipelotrichaceae bacterium]